MFPRRRIRTIAVVLLAGGLAALGLINPGGGSTLLASVSTPSSNFCPGGKQTFGAPVLDPVSGISYVPQITMPVSGGQMGIYVNPNGVLTQFNWPAFDTGGAPANQMNVTLAPSGSAIFNGGGFTGFFSTDFIGCTHVVNVSGPGSFTLNLNFTRNGTQYSLPITVTFTEAAWPQYGQNLRHTHQSPYVGSPSPSIKWSKAQNVYIGGIAVGADSNLYVPTEARVFSYKPNGALRWVSSFFGNVSWNGVGLGSDGTVYNANYDGGIRALNPATGTTIWSRAFSGTFGPPVIAGSTLYNWICCSTVMALNTSNGTTQWTKSVPSSEFSHPAVAPDGTIYVGAYGGQLTALNPNGSTKWTINNAGWGDYSPSIASDGTIYSHTGSPSGGFVAVNPNGTLKWRAAGVIVDNTYAVAGSPAIGPDGTVYFAGNNGRLYAFTPEGTKKWSFNSSTNGAAVMAPAVGADGVVYVMWSSSVAFAVNPNGTQKWSVSLGAGGYSYTEISIGSDGTVYVPAAGMLYAINGAATQLALASSPNPSNAGQTVTFTAILSGTPLGPGKGTVTFRDGSTVLGTESLDSTLTATLTTGDLTTVGAHVITATYNGNATLAAATATVVHNVVDNNHPPTIFVDNAVVRVRTGETPNNTGFFEDEDDQNVTVSANAGTAYKIPEEARNRGSWGWTGPAFDGTSYTVTVTANDGIAQATTTFQVQGVVRTSINLTCGAGPFTFTGAAQTPCTATLTAEDGSLNQPVTVEYTDNVNAGVATAVASYDGDATHDGAYASKSFTIGKAASSTTVSCGNGPFVYTGAAHTPCTASVSGVNLSLNPSPTYANNVAAGTATASYGFAGDANHEPSSGTASFTIGKAASTTTVSCADGPFVYSGAAQAPCSASVSGVNLSLSPSPSYANNVNAGVATASHTFAGDANHTGSSDSSTFAIGQAPSATSLAVSSSSSAVNQTVTLTATVSSPAPRAGIVTFAEGGTVLGTAAINAAGQATLGVSTLALGPHAVTAAYSGDGNIAGSASNPVSHLVYAYATASGATFVIGDGNASIGQRVMFWGAQWSKSNIMSGGASQAASSFKGFASVTNGTSWSGDTGNSAGAPAGLPSYLAVLVTSQVGKSGSSVSGNVVKLVVVRIDAGYGNSPSQTGTGTIVAAVY